LQQRRHVEVGIELGEMDAKAERFHFVHLEVVYGSVLQDLDVTRREAEFDTRRQPDDDAIAASIVMRAAWSVQPWNRLHASINSLQLMASRIVGPIRLITISHPGPRTWTWAGG
jgi:hypothetical protein